MYHSLLININLSNVPTPGTAPGRAIIRCHLDLVGIYIVSQQPAELKLYCLAVAALGLAPRARAAARVACELDLGRSYCLLKIGMGDECLLALTQPTSSSSSPGLEYAVAPTRCKGAVYPDLSAACHTDSL